MEAARAGDPGNLWVTATRQLEGRGRRGRAWASEPGNLYSSLLLMEPAPLSVLGQLPLVVAVGLQTALAGLPALDRDAVRIKWPNDILLHGAKCVGILIESERLATGQQAVVIGTGINVALKPEGQPYKVATLRECGFSGTVEDVFHAVALGINEALALWRRGENFGEVRRLWLDRSAGLGQMITVNLPDRSVSGRFVDLDLQGRLLLEGANGALEVFSAGDVFLLG
ncbi:biotin--[acetyl-CoA-carboxylase] ligase [Aureimonas fodinaquatilis]|uniref:biotin--[biotin carboxyl-carrier protein] ligase n=2 Tax=Aureimonas fodinaquatilis TaxID=2565783 RepID=A0A5B0DZS3_9HYPH|nr:biotin--[acetyl-CoA-carboxylase] ligase [Aureimonas fodinaquatilis]